MAKPTMNNRTTNGSSQTVQDLASAMQGVTIPDRMESVDMRDAAGAAAAASAPAAASLLSSSSSLLSGAMNEPALAARQATAVLFQHPDTAASSTAGTLRVPVETERRAFDDLGPPADPLDYPKPRIERGRRADVLCYFPSSDRHQVVKNVLFRDFSRGGGGGAGMSDAASSPNNNNNRDDAGDNRVKQAYWPVPHKRPIKTIMGHVEICIVLERCTSSSSRREDGDNDDDDDEDIDSTRSNSSSSAYDDEEDDDIVFQLTDKRVAVKVNYAEKMERLRNRHAEDPLKEIAAMQLIGDVHPHVLGCRDVLYDATSKTLNVVMRFCESGDLFELLQQQQTQQQNPDANTMGMTEGRARFWFRQFVAGIDYLHSVGICHRDLSPENVMIDSSNRCLIIDMGMALRVPYLNAGATTTLPAHQPPAVPNVTDVTRGGRRCLLRPQGACGKLPYMSPEIYRNRDPFSSEAVDLFTAGTILFCMLTGNRSYQTPQSSDPQFYWMTHGLEHLLADWNITLSPEGLHLLKNLLQINPRLRLTLHEVKHHPWFRFPDEPPPPALPRR